MGEGKKKVRVASTPALVGVGLLTPRESRGKEYK